MRVVVVALIIICASACAGSVIPQRKVAVLGVERHNGKNDRTLEAWIAKYVDRNFDVLAKQAYLQQAERLGADDRNERNIRRVAARVGAAAVVYGELSKKKNGRKTLTVWVHDGRTGALIETHQISIKAGKVDPEQERQFERELLALLPAPDAPVAKKAKKPKRAAPEDDDEDRDDEQDGERVADAGEDEVERPRVRKAVDEDDSEQAEDAAPPRAAAFEPARNATPIKVNEEGQAIDEEMPTMFAKRK